jgi:hypothetical protein
MVSAIQATIPAIQGVGVGVGPHGVEMRFGEPDLACLCGGT